MCLFLCICLFLYMCASLHFCVHACAFLLNISVLCVCVCVCVLVWCVPCVFRVGSAAVPGLGSLLLVAHPEPGCVR